MATAGELTIILQAQDSASAQIRALGQDVQRLERQVDSAARSTRSLSSGFGQLTQGLNVGAGFGAIQAGIAGLARAWDLVADSIVGANSRLEQQRGTLRALTGSASEAEELLSQLRREADVTPFDTTEMLQAGTALVSTAKTARVAVLDLVRTAEILAAFRPEQGLEGAAFALREAFEGNLQSITERFGITGAAIQRFRQQGLTTFQAITAAMQEMGLNSRLVQELANTFPGLSSNVISFFTEFRRRLGEGVFVRLEDGLRGLTGALARNGEAIQAWASRAGSVIGALVGRVGGLLGELAVRFLNWLDPGMGDQAREAFSGVADSVEQVGQASEQAAPQVQQLNQALSLPEARQALAAATGDLDRLQSLAARTAQPVAAINRELGDIGVRAAELQLGADRIRRSYDDQLRPLERQLDLLQNNIDLQRVQAGLAGNRATTERLRLERELQALQRSARGQEDPNAPGLTDRQRAIALALQERRLRLEELGLQEQQGPAIQTVQQRLQEVRRAQADALEPSERLLANYKDRVAELQTENQRWQNLKGAIQEAIDLVAQNPIRPRVAGPDDAEVQQRQAEFREAGEKLAQKFLDGWQEWLTGRAKAAWQTIADSFQEWYDQGGKEQVDKIGTAIGTAVGLAIGDAAEKSLKARLSGLTTVLDVLQAVLSGGAQSIPGAGVVTALPRVAGDVANVGTQGVTINLGPLPISVTMGGVNDPGFSEKLRKALTEFLQNFMAAEAGTDPGASSRLQGAGREP